MTPIKFRTLGLVIIILGAAIVVMGLYSTFFAAVRYQDSYWISSSQEVKLPNYVLELIKSNEINPEWIEWYKRADVLTVLRNYAYFPISQNLSLGLLYQGDHVHVESELTIIRSVSIPDLDIPGWVFTKSVNFDEWMIQRANVSFWVFLFTANEFPRQNVARAENYQTVDLGVKRETLNYEIQTTGVQYILSIQGWGDMPYGVKVNINVMTYWGRLGPYITTSGFILALVGFLILIIRHFHG